MYIYIQVGLKGLDVMVQSFWDISINCLAQGCNVNTIILLIVCMSCPTAYKFISIHNSNFLLHVHAYVTWWLYCLTQATVSNKTWVTAFVYEMSGVVFFQPSITTSMTSLCFQRKIHHQMSDSKWNFIKLVTSECMWPYNILYNISLYMYDDYIIVHVWWLYNCTCISEWSPTLRLWCHKCNDITITMSELWSHIHKSEHNFLCLHVHMYIEWKVRGSNSGQVKSKTGKLAPVVSLVIYN